MLILRLDQRTTDTDTYRIELSLDDPSQAPQTASAEKVRFALSAQEQEQFRWYPHDPTPTITARVERRMAEIGADRFEWVVRASPRTQALWYSIANRLSDARVEIRTGVREAAAIPWELLRGYQRYGADAAADVQRTQELIAQIESDLPQVGTLREAQQKGDRSHDRIDLVRGHAGARRHVARGRGGRAAPTRRGRDRRRARDERP